MSMKGGKRKRANLLDLNPYCCWCGEYLTPETATLEHLIPKSKGGSNKMWNLALACAPCNNRRSSSVDYDKLAVGKQWDPDAFKWYQVACERELRMRHMGKVILSKNAEISQLKSELEKAKSGRTLRGGL